jgi:hypothetical protein
MKQTPFYEISIALQGRPRMFRIVVVACLHLCFLALLQSVSALWQESSTTNSVKLEKKAADHFLSAKNTETGFSK